MIAMKVQVVSLAKINEWTKPNKLEKCSPSYNFCANERVKFVHYLDKIRASSEFTFCSKKKLYLCSRGSEPLPRLAGPVDQAGYYLHAQ